MTVFKPSMCLIYDNIKFGRRRLQVANLSYSKFQSYSPKLDNKLKANTFQMQNMKLVFLHYNVFLLVLLYTHHVIFLFF